MGRPSLAAAVADAGALGMVSRIGGSPVELSEMLDELRKQTSGVYGVNFILDPNLEWFDKSSIRECVEVAAAQG